MENRVNYITYIIIIILSVLLVYGVLYIRDGGNNNNSSSTTTTNSSIQGGQFTRPNVEQVISNDSAAVSDSLDIANDYEEVPDSLYTKKFNNSGSATISLKKPVGKNVQTTSASLNNK